MLDISKLRRIQPSLAGSGAELGKKANSGKWNTIFSCPANLKKENKIIKKEIEKLKRIAIKMHKELKESEAKSGKSIWSERSACAALGCLYKRRWPLFCIYYSLFSSCYHRYSKPQKGLS
jgi:hypothetical protein